MLDGQVEKQSHDITRTALIRNKKPGNEAGSRLSVEFFVFNLVFLEDF